MKIQISILMILVTAFLFGQNQSQTTTSFAGASTNINGLQANQEGTLINIQGTFSKILGLNILEFDDLIFAEASMEGSSLLFDDWKQSATFFASDKKYRINIYYEKELLNNSEFVPNEVRRSNVFWFGLEKDLSELIHNFSN